MSRDLLFEIDPAPLKAALGEALIPAHEPNGVLIRLINKL